MDRTLCGQLEVTKQIMFRELQTLITCNLTTSTSPIRTNQLVNVTQ